MKPEDVGLRSDLQFFKPENIVKENQRVTCTTIYSCENFSVCLVTSNFSHCSPKQFLVRCVYLILKGIFFLFCACSSASFSYLQRESFPSTTTQKWLFSVNFFWVKCILSPTIGLILRSLIICCTNHLSVSIISLSKLN